MQLKKFFISVLIALIVTAAFEHRVYAAPPEVELLEFIEQHLPLAWKELEQLKVHNADRYQAMLLQHKREAERLIRIREATPELFERLLEARRIEREKWHLAEEIRAAKGAEQSQFIAKLREMLGKVLDTRLLERKWQIDQLQSEITKLKEIVAKRERHREEIIERHIRELTGGRDKDLEW